MGQPIIVNNFRVTLAAALASNATTATLSSGSVAQLKAKAPVLKNGDYIPIVITQVGDVGSETAWTQANITGYTSGEGVTIEITPNGNTQSWAIGDKVEIRNTREIMNSLSAPLNNPQRRMLFIGDSRLQYAQPYRRPGIAANGAFDGRTVYVTTGSFSASTQWIAYGIIDGTAALNSQGIISSDAAGLLSYAHAGDTAGPKVDVSNGGWYYLQSGTNGVGITIAVRGAATKVLNAGGTYQTSGFPLSWDWDPRSHATWIAGDLADTFSDYQCYAIPGAVTQDIIKFLPQAFENPVEAVVMQLGVNNIPNTGSTLAQCQSLIADWKTIIDYASYRARKVYVGDILPAAVKDTTAQKYIAKANTAIRAYCRTKPNVRFVQCEHQVATFSTTVATSRAGCYFDDLHLMPYGAYRASLPMRTAIRRDYPVETQYKDVLDNWDATLQSGALNPNPMLVGTTGTGSGANGISGVVPTNWGMVRAGTTQTVVGSFEAATDNGPDWYNMFVTGDATAVSTVDYNTLQASINPFPTGIAVGDYFRLVIEIKMGAMTGNGLSVMSAYFNSNANANAVYACQLQPSWNVASFTGTEGATLTLYSEPQKILDISNPITLRWRIGAAANATANVGIRNFRIEKVPGPIYP